MADMTGTLSYRDGFMTGMNDARHQGNAVYLKNRNGCPLDYLNAFERSYRNGYLAALKAYLQGRLEP